MEEEGISDRAMKKVWTFIEQTLKSGYLSLILRLFLGTLFIYSAMTKIPYPAEFAEGVAAYRLFPYWSINFLALFIPWLELICGLFIIIGLTTRAAVSVIGVLLIAFSIAISINVIRRATISCGCFDTVGSPIGWGEVWRDIGLLFLAIQIFFFDRVFLLRRGGFGVRKKTGDSLSISK
jgi:uncharacterized membrane protein YphA (DoxX/SURF4 family)